MPEEPEPVDPLAGFAEGATAMHTLFVSFLDAGFTEGQAMRLVIAIIQAQQNPVS